MSYSKTDYIRGFLGILFLTMILNGWLFIITGFSPQNPLIGFYYVFCSLWIRWILAEKI